MSISPVVSIAAIAAEKVVGQAAGKLADFMDFLHADSPEEDSKATTEDSSSAKDLSLLLGDTVNIDQLQQSIQQSLTKFHRDLRQQLASRGFNSSLSFRLEGDQDGTVKVVGDHPHKQEIEQVLTSNPFLTSTFNYLSASSGLLRAAEEHQTFAREYAQDPLVASRLLHSRGNPSTEGTFGLIVDDDEIEVSYE